MVPNFTIFGSVVSNPGLEIWILSSTDEYGCGSVGSKLYTTPSVNRVTLVPEIVTGL